MRTALLALVCLGIGLWFWSDSLRSRERALRACRSACEQMGVQLLDQTVSVAGIGIGRLPSGRVALRRRYVFEFSTNGADRHGGSATLLGLLVEHLWLDHPDGSTIISAQGR